VGEAAFEPKGEFGVRLEPDPAPSDLNGHRSHRRRAGFGDAEVTDLIPAVVGRGSETREGGDLLATTNLAPSEELERKEPSGLQTNALEGHELADHLGGGVGVGGKVLELESFDETDALGESSTMAPLAQEPFTQLKREGRSIPAPKFVELIVEPPGERGDGQALGNKKSLDAVGHTSAFGLKGKELAVEMTSILGLDGRDMNDGPDIGLAIVVADEHDHELEDVNEVGLHSPVSTGDVDGGGVDDQVTTTGLSLDEAMDPKPVTSSFVAGDEGNGVAEVEPMSRLGDLQLEGVKATSGDIADPGLLAKSGTKGQLPGTVAEL